MPTHDAQTTNPTYPPVLKLIAPTANVVFEGFTDVPREVQHALLDQTKAPAPDSMSESSKMPSLVWAATLPHGGMLVLDPSGNPWCSRSGSLNKFYEDLKRRGPSPEECLDQIDDPSKPVPGVSPIEKESIDELEARKGDEEFLLVPVAQLGLRRSTLTSIPSGSDFGGTAGVIQTQAEYPSGAFALISFGDRSDHTFRLKAMALVGSRVAKFLDDLSNVGHSD